MKTERSFNIYLLHDPRMQTNQFNFVEDMIEGDFKDKCVSEGLEFIETFTKMEYDYLIDLGYVHDPTRQ